MYLNYNAMKQIIVFLILILSLTSCVKYTQPKLLSLSGDYRVDKITYEEVDNTSSSNNMVFYPGDMYVNPNEMEPFDSIPVGFFRMAFDYVSVRFAPTQMPDGSTHWGEHYFYNVVGETNSSLGTLIIEMNGTSRPFRIIEDGAETLVLRSSGQWASGSSGSDQSITLFLTRVGP